MESVIKCYALYLFLPCATRPNGSGHPGRCGNAACKGQNFHAELCPLSISPEIVGSRLNNGAASVFLRALGERHGGLQHALHCFWRKAPRFVIARRPEADVAISRHMPNHRKTIGEIAAAFPRLHPKGTSSRFALRAPRPLRGLAMARQAGAAVHQRSSAVESMPQILAACMALATRKGHAASVRRQSRQRLRRERRYRRNWLVRFIGTLYELEVPSRDCHGPVGASQ